MDYTLMRRGVESSLFGCIDSGALVTYWQKEPQHIPIPSLHHHPKRSDFKHTCIILQFLKFEIQDEYYRVNIRVFQQGWFLLDAPGEIPLLAFSSF